MMLVVVKGSNIGTVFPLLPGAAVIVGRGEESEVRLPDLKVSRRHCQIEEKNDVYYIRDLFSTNRTMVNGSVIDDIFKLKQDDIIEIGDTTLLFTSQKSIPIKSVEDYDMIRKSRTKKIE